MNPRSALSPLWLVAFAALFAAAIALFGWTVVHGATLGAAVGMFALALVAGAVLRGIIHRSHPADVWGGWSVRSRWL